MKAYKVSRRERNVKRNIGNLINDKLLAGLQISI